MNLCMDKIYSHTLTYTHAPLSHGTHYGHNNYHNNYELWMCVCVCNPARYHGHISCVTAHPKPSYNSAYVATHCTTHGYMLGLKRHVENIHEFIIPPLLHCITYDQTVGNLRKPWETLGNLFLP